MAFMHEVYMAFMHEVYIALALSDGATACGHLCPLIFTSVDHAL